MSGAALIFLLATAATTATAMDTNELEAAENDARIYSANGGLYMNFNSTTLMLVFFGILAVALVAYAVIIFADIPPAFEKQGDYYDPSLGAAGFQAAADPSLAYALQGQGQQNEYRQKRSLGLDRNVATKMHQLEMAFKKFSVEEEECRMYVACESAQLNKIRNSIPVVQIVSRIFRRNGGNKLEPSMERVNSAYLMGAEAHANKIPDACSQLKKSCTSAYNSNRHQ